jgi:hypothetical protein
MTFATLQDYLAQLTSGPVVPGSSQESDWPKHVETVSTAGQVVQISEDDWYFWLEVLPPRWQRGALFCFADGEEAFRLFWYRDGEFFARQLTNDETLTFCGLSGVRPPMIGGPRIMSAEERQLIQQHLHPPVRGCCGEGVS